MCAHLGQLAVEAGRLERAGIDSLHVDVMDGHFVPNLSFGPDTVAALRLASQLPIVVHAMVEEPASFVEPMARAGSQTFLFHIEACRYPKRLIANIEAHGMKAGIALNPATPATAIEWLVPLPLVLIMAVEPGFAGQDWIATSPAKVRRVRELCGPDTSIVVDGHVDAATIPILARAGADGFVCGTSSLFRRGHRSADYGAALASIRASLAAARDGQVA
jgi:ribulose-phosphate 3-epimerase